MPTCVSPAKAQTSAPSVPTGSSGRTWEMSKSWRPFGAWPTRAVCPRSELKELASRSGSEPEYRCRADRPAIHHHSDHVEASGDGRSFRFPPDHSRTVQGFRRNGIDQSTRDIEDLSVDTVR